MLARKVDGRWSIWAEHNGILNRNETTATVLYLDGRRAEITVEPYPVPVVLSADVIEAAWSDGDLAEFGLARVVPAVMPEGKRATGSRRLVEEKGVVHAVFDLEDEPPPPPPPTAREKVVDLARSFGLTIDELRRELAADAAGTKREAVDA